MLCRLWLATCSILQPHWLEVVCRFVSTFGSTFSANVNRIRGYHSSCLVPDKGIYFVNWPTNEVRSPPIQLAMHITMRPHSAPMWLENAIATMACSCSRQCWFQNTPRGPPAGDNAHAASLLSCFITWGRRRLQADFKDSIANNRRWTAMTWWPQHGMPVYGEDLCHREFVMTWEFHTQPQCINDGTQLSEAANL